MKCYVLIIFIALTAITTGCASTTPNASAKPATTSTSADSGDADAFNAHSGWVTFKKIETKDGFKIFRRYAYTSEGFQNILLYNCSREPRKVLSHLTVILPRDYVRRFALRNSWKPNATIRILVDDKYSITVDAEYIGNEVFIDDSEKNRDGLRKILLADSLKIATSNDDNPLFFIFTEKMDSFFREAAPKFGYPEKFGAMTHFSRFEMEDACRKYQSTGK